MYTLMHNGREVAVHQSLEDALNHYFMLGDYFVEHNMEIIGEDGDCVWAGDASSGAYKIKVAGSDYFTTDSLQQAEALATGLCSSLQDGLHVVVTTNDAESATLGYKYGVYYRRIEDY